MNNGTLNPALFSASQHIKDQVINQISRLKRERRILKEEINMKAVKNENYQDLLQSRITKKELKLQKYEEFNIRMKGMLQKFKDNEMKNFMRLNEKYYCSNQKLLKILQKLSQEANLNFKQLGILEQDIVIYKEEDPINFPIYLSEKRNENHPRLIQKQLNNDQQVEQQQITQQPIQQQQEQQQFQGQPPDVIKEIFVQTDIDNESTIIIKFDTPEDWGSEIIKYRIYELIIDDQQLEPNKRMISEFQHFNQNVQLQKIKFVQKLQNKNELLFDKMNYISIEAYNKCGWSSDYDVHPIKLYIQYNKPLSLYIKGIVNPAIISEDCQLIELIYGNPQIVTINKSEYLFIEDFSLIILEKENLRNVSIKHDSIGLVNVSFQACQWGEVLSFDDTNDTTKYQVDPKLDFIYCTPYQVNTPRAISKIACGFYHSLAITVDGNILSWGYNSHGQLGNGTNLSDMQPHEISYFHNNQLFIVDIQAGQQISMCRTDQGDVYCWGKMQNDFGEKMIKVINSFQETINLQCADTDNQQRVPRKINLKAKQITMGYECFGALSLDDHIYMWGSNEKAVMGFEKCPYLDFQEIFHLIDPIRINLDSYKIKEFIIGAYHCVAKILNNEKEEYISWGNNDFNQCGQNKLIKSKRGDYSFCDVNKINNLPDKQYISYSCGYDRTIFLSSDNKIYTFCDSSFEKKQEDCAIFANKVIAADQISYILGLE